MSAEPSGVWVLVPREPTEEMLKPYCGLNRIRDAKSTVRNIYRDMLDALANSPPPHPEGGRGSSGGRLPSSQAGSDTEAALAGFNNIQSLLASAWFYGNWKAETNLERKMQAVMERDGWWPIADEADLLAKLGFELPENDAREVQS